MQLVSEPFKYLFAAQLFLADQSYRSFNMDAMQNPRVCGLHKILG